MTDPKFVYPTEAEIRAMHNRALHLRAEYTRALVAGAWARIRSIFPKGGVRQASAH